MRGNAEISSLSEEISASTKHPVRGSADLLTTVRSLVDIELRGVIGMDLISGKALALVVPSILLGAAPFALSDGGREHYVTPEFPPPATYGVPAPGTGLGLPAISPQPTFDRAAIDPEGSLEGPPIGPEDDPLAPAVDATRVAPPPPPQRGPAHRPHLPGGRGLGLGPHGPRGEPYDPLGPSPSCP